MNKPESLSVEVAAWMRMQMTIAAARAVQPLREELARTEAWANGIFALLVDLLPGLLREHPELVNDVAPQWARATARFEQLAEGKGTPEDDESPELLEARKMAFNLCCLLKVF